MQEKFVITYLPIFDVTANHPEADEKVFLNGALLCTIENIIKVFDKFYERTIDIVYEVRYTYINQRSKKSIKIVIVDYCKCRITCIALYI